MINMPRGRPKKNKDAADALLTEQAAAAEKAKKEARQGLLAPVDVRELQDKIRDLNNRIVDKEDEEDGFRTLAAAARADGRKLRAERLELKSKLAASKEAPPVKSKAELQAEQEGAEKAAELERKAAEAVDGD